MLELQYAWFYGSGLFDRDNTELDDRIRSVATLPCRYHLTERLPNAIFDAGHLKGIHQAQRAGCWTRIPERARRCAIGPVTLW
jgi:hypothetical protein